MSNTHLTLTFSSAERLYAHPSPTQALARVFPISADITPPFCGHTTNVGGPPSLLPHTPDLILRKCCEIHLPNALSIQCLPTVSTAHSPLRTPSTCSLEPWELSHPFPSCLADPLCPDSGAIPADRLALWPDGSLWGGTLRGSH